MWAKVCTIPGQDIVPSLQFPVGEPTDATSRFHHSPVEDGTDPFLRCGPISRQPRARAAGFGLGRILGRDSQEKKIIEKLIEKFIEIWYTGKMKKFE